MRALRGGRLLCRGWEVGGTLAFSLAAAPAAADVDDNDDDDEEEEEEEEREEEVAFEIE